MIKQNNATHFFLVGLKVTLISLLLLILAGGIVRSSGSGMGCPDWPKCFNRVIPPTSVNELPQGYEEKFLAGRLKKNLRLSKLLVQLGFADLGTKVASDPEVRKVENFNAFKTWAEYINRLIGALTGLFFLMLLFLSLPFWKTKRILVWITGVNLLLIFIQAYLGSLVVSTNLLSGLITVHMILAIVILILLIWSYYITTHQEPLKEFIFGPFPYSQALFGLMIFAVSISFVQILLGTSVRSSFDGFIGILSSANFEMAAGRIFPLHRLVSVLVLVVNGYLAYIIQKRFYLFKALKKQVFISFAFIIMQMVLGFSLEIGHLPPFSQALHVFLAVLLFASQVWEVFLLESLKPMKLISQEI